MTDDKKNIPNAGNADWPPSQEKLSLSNHLIPRCKIDPPQSLPATTHGLKAASTLGLRLDNRIFPMPPGPPQPVCVRMAALPIPSFSSGVMACSIPHSFPFRRILDVSDGPIQFPDCRQPAQEHRSWCACADWRRVETRLNLR